MKISGWELRLVSPEYAVDVNKLASLPPKELRRYVRRVIDTCSPGGRFAVGAGNSIPSYIPVENYLTMLDEALR